MKIDYKFIEQWEPQYDYIESDEGEYRSLIERMSKEFKDGIEQKCHSDFKD